MSKLALEAAVRGHHSAQAKPGVLDVVVLDTECLGHALRDPGDDEPALSLNDGVLQNIHHEDMLAHAAGRTFPRERPDLLSIEPVSVLGGMTYLWFGAAMR